MGHADVGVGQHRLGGLDVVVGESRRAAYRAAGGPRGDQARLGALPDQAAQELYHAGRFYTAWPVCCQISTATGAARAKHFGEARPGSATIIVNALVMPEWLIEIEAVAAAKA